MHLKKCLSFIVLVSVFFSSILPSYAMDDHNPKSTTIKKRDKEEEDSSTDEYHSSEQDSLLGNQNTSNTSSANTIVLNYSETKSINGPATEAEKLRIRIKKTINNIITNNPKTFRNYPQFASGLFSYEERTNKSATNTWDDVKIFYPGFNHFFKEQESIPTWLLKGFGALVGSGNSRAIPPLFFYLTEKLPIIEDIPIAGDLSTAIYWGLLGATLLPCANQLWEQGGKIGNFFFDKNGFTPSKDDKKPHVQVGSPWYFKPIAAINGLLNLPNALLFFRAESFFPRYMWTYGPSFTLFNFFKGYNEGMDFCSRTSNAFKNKDDPVCAIKRKVLLTNLHALQKLINSNGSDSLVHILFTQLKKYLEEFKGGEDNYIPPICFLILKLDNFEPYEKPREDLKQKTERINEQVKLLKKDARKELGNSPSKSGHQDERKITVSPSEITVPTEYFEDVEDIISFPFAAYQNFLQTLDKTRTQTKAARVLNDIEEKAQNLALPGIFVSALWALTKTSNYFGWDNNYSYYTVLAVSILATIFVACEQYRKKKTFSDMRKFGSTKMDFWPLRWAGNFVSAIVATCLALTTFAIIDDELQESSFASSLLGILTLPYLTNSYYKFFKEKNDNLITGVVTKKIMKVNHPLPKNAPFSKKMQHWITLKQERAWLNVHIKKLMDLIPYFDSETINQIFTRTQKSV